MGQYHKIVNLDKKQYIHAHHMNCGLKALEQVGFEMSPSTALFMLLMSSNGRGGGDFRGDHPLIGSWVGDRVAVVGDYVENGDIPGVPDDGDLYSALDHDVQYTDISEQVLAMLAAEFGAGA